MCVRMSLVCTLAAGSTLLVTFFIYKHYRTLPLDPVTYQHSAKLLSATSSQCMQNREWYGDRLLVLQANPDFLTLKIGQEKLPVEGSSQRLTDLLQVRMDPSAFLVDNSPEDGGASWLLLTRLRQTPILNNLCIIDPKHPPVWYPPKPRLISCGAGDLRRFRKCRSIRQ
jgi:hypothetical protein